jgi:hypothetical protein
MIGTVLSRTGGAVEIAAEDRAATTVTPSRRLLRQAFHVGVGDRTPSAVIAPTRSRGGRAKLVVVVQEVHELARGLEARLGRRDPDAVR